jgi:transposase
VRAISSVDRLESVDEVLLGVDTHLDVNVAVALDQLGRRLGELKVPTTTRGYERLLRWAEGFGPVGCAGVEGTSSYGAGLARHFRAMAIPVMEVERPKRRHLRRKGKSDPIDAEAAARAVLSGEAAGVPKSADGRVEMIRTLRSAPRSAVKARTQAANQLQGFVVTAPEELRHRLRELTTKKLVAVAARMRPGKDLDGVEAATKFALRSVARRYQALSEEISELDAQLDHLVAEAAPELIPLPAIGTDHAATLLLTVGDNPERLGSEASFASLCGVSPVQASSGKVVRHRLNRGGNRDANRALHLICLVRMRIDERTRASPSTGPATPTRERPRATRGTLTSSPTSSSSGALRCTRSAPGRSPPPRCGCSSPTAGTYSRTRPDGQPASARSC